MRSGLMATFEVAAVGVTLCGAAFFACGGSSSSTGSTGCHTDNDCKGVRICQAGQCVDPGATSGNGPSATTSTGSGPGATSTGAGGAGGGKGHGGAGTTTGTTTTGNGPTTGTTTTGPGTTTSTTTSTGSGGDIYCNPDSGGCTCAPSGVANATPCDAAMYGAQGYCCAQDGWPNTGYCSCTNFSCGPFGNTGCNCGVQGPGPDKSCTGTVCCMDPQNAVAFCACSSNPGATCALIGYPIQVPSCSVPNLQCGAGFHSVTACR
jgi:hypothetical protein